MFGDCNCFDCPIPLYGDSVTSPIMCHFNIPQPLFPQQHEITRICHIIMKYSKRNYVKNAMNIYLQISDKPIGFVVVWFAILKLYGVGLGFGSPNLNFKCFMIILTLEPPSSNTSSILFFLICIWTTTIWLYVATIVVPTFSIEQPTCFLWLLYLNFEFLLVLTFAKDIFLTHELF